MKRFALTVVILLSIGCTESVYMTTAPPGAKVFVNNREVGVSPFDFEAPSKDLPSTQYNYRIELPGYRPAEGRLPVRVSVGRVIGSVFTLGILYAIRGVHVFGEDVFQQGLYPLDAVTAKVDDSVGARSGSPESDANRRAADTVVDTIDGAPSGTPHSRKVFVTSAPLDSLPQNSYVFLKDLEVESEWYGTGNLVLEEIAREARRIGADAVFEADYRWRPGMWAWARPIASGKAIALRYPCATRGISGTVRPTGEADTPKNRAASERCDDFRNTTTSRPAQVSGKCTVEQVLTMKAAGLSDEQVEAACAK